MDNEIISRIFGATGELYVPFILGFEAALPAFKYTPLSQDEIDSINVVDSTPDEIADNNQKIWRDQLLKFHIAAITSILRGSRWIKGMIQASKDENLLAFGASFRGLLEASADTLDALKDLPYNLASNYPIIKKALDGNLDDKIWGSPEMEALADHFIFARKQPKGFTGPKVLRAKTARNYIEALQRAGKGNVVDCYSLLCELTHPASLTVSFLIEDDGTQLKIHNGKDESLIDELSTEFAEAIQEALRAFNFAFMILKVVNRLPLPELATPTVDQINFDNDPEWVEVRKNMT